MLWSPTIRAALIAGRPWLDLFCSRCGTSWAIDLRTVDRHPASVATPRVGADAEDLLRRDHEAYKCEKRPGSESEAAFGTSGRSCLIWRAQMLCASKPSEFTPMLSP
jgi:hypothetical protein